MPTITVPRRHIVQHRSHAPQSAPGRALRAVLDLGALPTAPGCARAWTRQILREWRLADLSDTAELIVSELITNAMVASRLLGRPFMRLMLTLGHGELAVLVRDYCPSAPQPRNAGDEDENGRGLLLVEAMSARSGWYPPDDGAPGKVVWAALTSGNVSGPAQALEDQNRLSRTDRAPCRTHSNPAEGAGRVKVRVVLEGTMGCLPVLSP